MDRLPQGGKEKLDGSLRDSAIKWETEMAALRFRAEEPVQPKQDGPRERRLPPPPSWWRSGPDATTSNLVAAEDMAQLGRRRRR